MTEQSKDGGPAFPSGTGMGLGMSLRDYFAVRGPEPTKEQITHIMEMEKLANPHNEAHHNKTRLRGYFEISIALRWEWADTMLVERNRQHNGEKR